MQQSAENEKEGREDIQNEINNENKQKKARWFKLLNGKLVALFVLGILIGVTLKTQALKTVTMGFDDYRLKETKHYFILTQKQEQVSETEDETGGSAQEEIQIENEAEAEEQAE